MPETDYVLQIRYSRGGDWTDWKTTAHNFASVEDAIAMAKEWTNDSYQWRACRRTTQIEPIDAKEPA